LVVFFVTSGDLPRLHQLALRLGKSNAALCIYGPYHCKICVVLHLRSLGLNCICNRNGSAIRKQQQQDGGGVAGVRVQLLRTARIWNILLCSMR
jgi:hypothetical protein